MTEFLKNEWVRAAMGSPRGVWRTNGAGQVFLCQFLHADGEGLIEVFTRHSTATGICAVQLSCAGELLGILRIRPDGPEEIEFDRDQGIGDHRRAAERTAELLRGLGPFDLRGVS